MTKITEKKPKGLWANIHAKRKRGEKSDPRSKEYKAAKKAGEKIRKQNEELAEPDGTIKFGTDSKDVKKMQKKGHTSVPYGSGYDKVNEASSNFKVLLRTAMEERPGRKIRLGKKSDPDHEVWVKMGKPENHWICKKGKHKGVIMDANEWARHADKFHMDNKELKFESKMYKDVSDKFKDALDRLPQKLFTSKNVAKLAKKMKEKRPDAAMAYAKDAFGWLMKENKLRTELRKHIVKEINTIFNSLP